MEDLERIKKLVRELDQRIDRLERLYVSLAIYVLNPAEVLMLYAVDRVEREKGIGAP